MKLYARRGFEWAEDGLAGLWSPVSTGATQGILLDCNPSTNNHGTLTGYTNLNTAWVGSQHGTVLDFDGTNDHIPITTFRSVPTQNRLTSSAWVRFAGTATRIEIIHFVGSNFINTAFFLYRNATGKLVSEFGNGTAAATGATTIIGGSWNLLTATYDGAVNRVYLNGVLDASTSYVSANIIKQQIIISAYYQDNAGGTTPLLPLIGQNAESCIWNRALTAGEIQTLYQAGPGGMWQLQPRRSRVYFSSAGFRAYWARRQSQLIGGGV